MEHENSFTDLKGKNRVLDSKEADEQQYKSAEDAATDQQGCEHIPVTIVESPTTGSPIICEDIPAGPTHGTSSVLWTTINMMCNVIGGGVLALPIAFHRSSLLIGFVLMFAVAGITISNLYFIMHCAEFASIYVYRDLLRKGLGSLEASIVDFSLFVFPFSALCAYCGIVAHSMPPVVENFLGAPSGSFFASKECWLLISGIVFFALSCRRSLNEIRISSIFGLATIFYLVIMVVVYFFDGSYSKTRTTAEVPDDFKVVYLRWDIFSTVPLIVFSLSVHNNAPTYYEELADRSPENFVKVIKYSHSGIITTYLLMAVFGLLTFDASIEKSEGDILNMYRGDDVPMNLARLLMFVHFACVYPILQMAARRGFNNFVFKRNDLKLSYLCIESFFLVLSSVLIAQVVPDVDIILGIAGGLFGSVIVMIAPSLLFLRMDPFNSAATGGVAKSRVVAVLSICTGVITAVTGIAFTIMDIVRKVQ